MKTQIKVEKVILNSENYEELVNTIETLENQVEILTLHNKNYESSIELFNKALEEANVTILNQADVNKPYKLEIACQQDTRGLEFRVLVVNK